MLHVALLRNVNVGQRASPTTAQILAAFAEATIVDAQTFQSNGTVIFTASPDAAQSLAQDAVAALARATGLDREVFTRPLESLRPIVEQHGDTADARLRELTLHDGPRLLSDDPAVLDAERRARCTVLDSGTGWAVVLNHREHQGNGTPLVERIVGTPASSRGIPTMTRLLEKYGASP
ncbi:MAG: DUF1697 domain-containing protein [Microcella sp.]|uniref:DUF1697 domain-containing protein n=1 Tax=Microcella sp. TaxID=1913979 RepID=UPI0024CB9684|nr:DUF1697 domain-containing protein [Microcella sp.]UYN84425.1 MAG: DUF1697 domain-containing protein [Microcella sp.]